MRRLIALILSCSLICGTLVGCGKNDEEGQEDQFTQGELLTLICDAFGMDSYTGTEPYYDSVPADSPYFDQVQMCVEWNVIDPADGDFDVTVPVTRGAMALASVNAGEFVDVSVPDEQKLTAARQLKLIGDEPVEEKVTREEGADCVALAAKLWSEFTVEDPVQQVELAPGVKDLVDQPVQTEDGLIRVPTSAGELQPGDHIVYNTPEGPSAAEVGTVTEQGGYYLVEESEEELDLEEFLEDVVIQETYSPDLSAATFTDANGVVYPGAGFQVNNTAAATGGHGVLLGGQSGGNVQNCGGKREYTFACNGFEIKVSVDGSDVGVELSKESEDKKEELKGGVELNGVQLTTDIKGIKNFKFKVNYQCKASGTYSYKFHDKIVAPYNNGNGKFLSNLKRSQLREAEEKGAKAIKIGSWDIYNAGVAQIKLELKVELSVTGEISASVTISGCNGVQLKNGNLRFIKQTSTDKDVTFKASASVTAGLGLSLKLLQKFDIIGFWVKAGIGGEASVIIHMVDTEHHLIEQYTARDLFIPDTQQFESTRIKGSPLAILNAAIEQGVPDYLVPDGDQELRTETCLDVKVYLKLTMSAEPGKKLKKIFPLKNMELELLGEDNATFLKLHVENWDFSHPVDECTKEFTPFAPSDTAESPKPTPDHDAPDLKQYLMVMGDEPMPLELDVPEGETAPDVVWSSEDLNVATVDQNGMVTPVGDGRTNIVVSLADDPTVTVKCSVIVESYTEDDWEFLPDDVMAGV